MSEPTPLLYKTAETPDELEQVHALNYRTFVEEIPQHGANPDRKLVDARLEKSIFYIAKRGEQVVGMVAISAERPFSIDKKLPDLDSYLPHNSGLCEVRLLAVEAEERGGAIFAGLAGQILAHCKEHGYEIGLISGTTTQLPLYRHFGFVQFGPLLGSGEARFQGMYVTWDSLGRAARRLTRMAKRGTRDRGSNEVRGGTNG